MIDPTGISASNSQRCLEHDKGFEATADWQAHCKRIEGIIIRRALTLTFLHLGRLGLSKSTESENGKSNDGSESHIE